MDDMEGTASTTYEPAVKYTYSVAEQTYTGERIGYCPTQFDYGTASKNIFRYPVGSTVRVRYDPQDPAKALLETKGAGSKLFISLGIFFLVVGVCAGCGVMVYGLMNLR